jgi:cyclase
MKLVPKRLGDGVYALIAEPPPKDNGGVIFGSSATLVIDAGVNAQVAREIQRIASELSPAPLRYLVNTSYHGDHTFGNSAFPESVVVISSYQNRESMKDLDAEKRIRGGNMYGNAEALADVRSWRQPEITFDRFLLIDLGDQEVELWHFGPGNAPGDTIVYSPHTRIAWTGNFLGHAHIAPMLLEGSPEPYIASLKAMRATLELDKIIPGYGPMDKADAAIDSMIRYLEWLLESVQHAVSRKMSERDAIESITPPKSLLHIPLLAPASVKAQLVPLNAQMHRLNVMSTYRHLQWVIPEEIDPVLSRPTKR